VNRRQTLRLLTGAITSSVASRWSAVYGQTGVRLTPLNDDLAVITGAGTNLLVRRADNDGLLLVDSGLAIEDANIHFVLKNYSSAPVAYLINTHWHPRHTDGNPNFGNGGAEIVAHINCLKRLSTNQRLTFPDRIVEPLSPEGLPKQTFVAYGERRHGGETIRYTHLPQAHTDGDAVVRFANANVYHCGDLFYNRLYPYIDFGSGGSAEGMIAGAAQILGEIDERTTLIPGHGTVGVKAELRAFYDMLADVNEKVDTLRRQGNALDRIQAAQPTARYDEVWGRGRLSGSEFVRLLYSGKARKEASNRA
jgi:glyoxylase-like metal-dependent hydrolase (beta-lactamase superfamily II)